MISNSNRYDIPNLRKACEVIKVIASSQEGLSFKAIQTQTSIPRTTLIRILETLGNQEFVRQRSNRTYLLGNELLRMGLQFSNSLDLKDLSTPVLEHLANATRATSHLAVPSGNKSLIVVVQESPERVRAASKPGFLADLHCSSTGKCFLAHLMHDPIGWFVETNPPSHTNASITDPQQLSQELDHIRERGYAVDHEEYSKGVRCCAAPVRNAAGTVIAAVGVTAPSSIFIPEKESQVAEQVVQAARELSSLLGYEKGR